jgi:hypothetical protein
MNATTTARLPLIEVSRLAVEILQRELGVADTLRFMSQFSSGQGDYSAERDRMFAGATLDQLIGEIKQGRTKE